MIMDGSFNRNREHRVRGRGGARHRWVRLQKRSKSDQTHTVWHPGRGVRRIACDVWKDNGGVGGMGIEPNHLFRLVYRDYI